MPQKLLTFGAAERTWAMEMQLSGGLEPTTTNGRAKDVWASNGAAWREWGEIQEYGNLNYEKSFKI